MTRDPFKKVSQFSSTESKHDFMFSRHTDFHITSSRDAGRTRFNAQPRLARLKISFKHSMVVYPPSTTGYHSNSQCCCALQCTSHMPCSISRPDDSFAALVLFLTYIS